VNEEDVMNADDPSTTSGVAGGAADRQTPAAGTPAPGTPGAAPLSVAEATGFDPAFLGVPASLPRLDDVQAAASVELAYEHFTVLLDTNRRFAAVTGVNIDGANLVKVPRNDRWVFDDRVPEELQAGPEVYADNDLDRGHLVRRNDPVWGDPAVAARANDATFHFTNAAPQASDFNQGRELWVGLEDHVLEHARVHKLKLSVFTGPVFGADDPPYRGIRIPLKFWKVAAWSTGETLATTGFLVDQSPLVDVDLLPRELGAPPPLGPFRTFQVRVADIAELTGLSMPELVAAENLPRGVPAWRQLETADDILV
jgi:endonuclease G